MRPRPLGGSDAKPRDIATLTSHSIVLNAETKEAAGHKFFQK